MRWLVVLSLAALALGCEFGETRLDAQWEQFKVDFEKTYDTPEEEQARKLIFAKNLGFIESHNKHFSSGVVSHDLGVNQFSDWSDEEYHGYLTLKPFNASAIPREYIADVEPLAFDVPATFDWRSQNGVTPIKNQGQCGSCWAFATVASVESQYLIKGTTKSLSEQQLVDCDKQDGGCNGGYADRAFNYIKSTGLETETEYPYKAKGASCADTTSKSHTKISSYKMLPQRSSDATIKAAIQQYGPLTVQIDASGNDFSQYKSGIISTGSKNMNHMVLAIGWGSNYWIIKNSWGTSWGLSGYGYIATGNDVRGFNEVLYYPTV